MPAPTHPVVLTSPSLSALFATIGSSSEVACGCCGTCFRRAARVRGGAARCRVRQAVGRPGGGAAGPAACPDPRTVRSAIARRFGLVPPSGGCRPSGAIARRAVPHPKPPRRRRQIHRNLTCYRASATEWLARCATRQESPRYGLPPSGAPFGRPRTPGHLLGGGSPTRRLRPAQRPAVHRARRPHDRGHRNRAGRHLGRVRPGLRLRPAHGDRRTLTRRDEPGRVTPHGNPGAAPPRAERLERGEPVHRMGGRAALRT